MAMNLPQVTFYFDSKISPDVEMTNDGKKILKFPGSETLASHETGEAKASLPIITIHC